MPKKKPAVEDLCCTQCGSTELAGVCKDCGGLAENLLALLEQQQEHLEVARRENFELRSRMYRLQGEDFRKLKQSKHYPNAMKLLAKWKQLCHPTARELESKKRLEPLIARLNGDYGIEQLETCLVGYSGFPYLVNGRRASSGSPAQWKADASFIFQDPQHVDEGIRLAAEVVRREKFIRKVSQDEPVQGQVPLIDSSGRPSLSKLGRAALQWVHEYGFFVFPVAPRAKVPVTAHGLLDATQEEERITRFWIKHPEHNIGIRCGIESGLVVLDVDGDEGLESLRALEKRFASIPTTASIVTPRGGQHYYFRHPGVGQIFNTTSFPGPGLDIRADGGYVLAPPSIGANGRSYEVDEESRIASVPKWLIELLVNRQTKLPAFRGDPIELVDKGVREGARNSQLTSLIGKLINYGHTPEQVFAMARMANEARCSPPLPEKEIARSVESILKRERRKAKQMLMEMTTHDIPHSQ